jgi:hypothetical protein
MNKERVEDERVICNMTIQQPTVCEKNNKMKERKIACFVVRQIK